MAPTHTTPDLQRLGIFKEQSYTSIGDPYRDPKLTTSFRSAFLTSGTKSISATSDGFFSPFLRTFRGEASENVSQVSRRKPLKAWHPPSPSKEPCGLGSSFGTLSIRPAAYFNPRERYVKSARTTRRGIYTNPPQKGTGAGIGLSPYPLYLSDPYDKTEVKALASKKQTPFRLGARPTSGVFCTNPFEGGTMVTLTKPQRSKSAPVKRTPFRPAGVNTRSLNGCINPYPGAIIEGEPKKAEKKKGEPKKALRPFTASGGLKSYPVASVIAKNVQKSITPLNYTSLKRGIVYTYA